jgi:hypothetical protein
VATASLIGNVAVLGLNVARPSRGEVELGVEARRKREGIAIVIYSAERLRLNTDGDQGDPEFEGEVTPPQPGEAQEGETG